MERKAGISRYTAEALERLVREEGSRSDWDRAGAKSHEEIEAAEGDAAEEGMVIDRANAQIGLPEPKAVLHMRIDRDILDFFRRGRSGLSDEDQCRPSGLQGGAYPEIAA